MKCLKYQFMSPLYGEVMCDALIEAYEGRVELDEESTLTLFNNHSEFEAFLDDHMEDLAEYVPEQLKERVIKAEFGHHCAMDAGLRLLTEVTVKGESRLSTKEECELREWITGQLSDGWGESIEQRAVMTKYVDYHILRLDEEGELVEEEECEEARYFFKPWISGRWSLVLFDIEEVEVDIEDDSMPPIKLVHSFALPQPYKGLRLINIYAGSAEDMKVFLSAISNLRGLNTHHHIVSMQNPKFCNCSRYYIAVYHEGFQTGIYPTIGIKDEESGYKWIFEDTGEIMQHTLEGESMQECDDDISSWMIQELIINHH